MGKPGVSHLSSGWETLMAIFNKIILLSLAFLVLLNAQENPLKKTFKIKYISANHVYLDGGIDDGISTGDTLKVLNKTKISALLKVIYVSAHSASCEVINSRVTLKTGMSAVLNQIIKDVKRDQKKVKTRVRQIVKGKRGKRNNSARVSGYIGLQ